MLKSAEAIDANEFHISSYGSLNYNIFSHFLTVEWIQNQCLLQQFMAYY